MRPLHIRYRTTATPNSWEAQHNLAVTSSAGFPIERTGVNAKEAPLVQMLTAWAEYAEAFHAQYDGGIGDDFILGPCWTEIGTNIRSLLNGELGRLDGGTLDKFIHDTMRDHGVDVEAL